MKILKRILAVATLAFGLTFVVTNVAMADSPTVSELSTENIDWP